MGLTAEGAEQSYQAFAAALDFIDASLKAGTGRIILQFGGKMSLEFRQEVDLPGITPDVFREIAQDILALAVAAMQGQQEEVVKNASEDGSIAVELTNRKLARIEESEVLNYIRPRFRFRANSQAIVFDRSSAYVRTTPVKDNTGSAIVSADYRLVFRDNVTGEEVNVVRFEADGNTLNTLAKMFADMRDQVRDFERRLEDGKGKGGSEGSPN